MSGTSSVTVLILFIGVMFAGSVMLSAGAEYINNTANSNSEVLNDIRETKNTEFTISDIKYDNSTNELSITMVNTGAETIKISDIDLVVDGEYRFYDSAIGNNSDRTVLNPNEKLLIEVDNTTEKPSNVKLSVRSGIEVNKSP